MDTSRSPKDSQPSTGLPQPLVSLVDPGTFTPAEDELKTPDPLNFPGYAEALTKAGERASSDESVIAGRATIDGLHTEVAGFDFGFLGGSMGEVAGERLARAMSRAARRRVPFILATATGGARMQEGMRALIQMPKVIAARQELTDAREPFVAVLGDPTTGGVLASIAALADVTLAESDATIGFAGPRVVEGFTGEPLPEDSHSAEAALKNGLVDDVCPSDKLRERTATILRVIAPGMTEAFSPPVEVDIDAETFDTDGWEIVRSARSRYRATAPDLLKKTAEPAFLLRGDRAGAEDPSVRTAIVHIGGRPAMALATDRATAPGPAAYRKATRCIRVAGRLGLPVVTLVDMSGADPSAESEAGGIAWAIAETFQALLDAPVPTISVITGEGGSGGALAFAATDRVIAWHDSFFTVIAPEMAAEIIWRDPKRAAEIARSLKLTAPDLKRFGIADQVVRGDLNPERLKEVLAYHLDAAAGSVPAEDRVRSRYQRWRKT